MANDDAELERQDTALIRRLLDRKPSPYPHLLKGGHGTTRGLIGPSVSSASGLVDDYFELGHRAAARTVEEPKLDLALLPVLFLYRHAVELSLKYAIALLIRAVEDCEGAANEEVPEHHNLASLLAVVNRLYPTAKDYLSQAGVLEPLSSQSITFIRELHDLDPTGETFRYVYRKEKNGTRRLQLETDVNIDVDALTKGMLHIQNEVTWFMDTLENGLGMIDDYKADMFSDVSPW